MSPIPIHFVKKQNFKSIIGLERLPSKTVVRHNYINALTLVCGISTIFLDESILLAMWRFSPERWNKGVYETQHLICDKTSSFRQLSAACLPVKVKLECLTASIKPQPKLQAIKMRSQIARYLQTPLLTNTMVYSIPCFGLPTVWRR